MKTEERKGEQGEKGQGSRERLEEGEESAERIEGRMKERERTQEEEWVGRNKIIRMERRGREGREKSEHIHSRQREA